MSVEEMRREYGRHALLESVVAADPIEQFRRWFEEAIEHNSGGWFEPNAMTLATVGADGIPAARIVLLKQYDRRGFVFFTNYLGDKGRQIAANAHVALLFHWPEFERQVRITGMAAKTTRAESEDYFRRRPRNSQLGAAVSHQSQVVADRAVLEKRMAELARIYEGREVAMPENWGGYRVRPERVEFWQGQRSRLHDRLLYRRCAEAEDEWKIERLSP